MSPLSRLCLLSPTIDSARLLALAFSCYHAIKLGNRDLVDSCIQSKDFEPVCSVLVSVAAAHSLDFFG